MLIRNGIALNRALVHALFGVNDSQTTYDATGKSQDAPPVRSCLDRELCPVCSAAFSWRDTPERCHPRA